MKIKGMATILLISLALTGCKKDSNVDHDVDVKNSNVIKEHKNDVEDKKEKDNKNINKINKKVGNLDFPQLDIVFNGKKLKMPIELDELKNIFNVTDDYDNAKTGRIEIDNREYKYKSVDIGSTYLVYHLEKTNKRLDIDLPYGINTKEDSWANIKEKVPFENWVTLSRKNDSAFFYVDNTLIELIFSSDNKKVSEVNFFSLHGESLEKFKQFMAETHGDVKGDSSVTINGKDLKLPLYFDNFDEFKKVPLDKSAKNYKDILDFFINSDRRKSTLGEDRLAEKMSDYLQDNFDEIDFYGDKLVLRRDMPKEEESDDSLSAILAKDRYFELIIPKNNSISIKNKFITLDDKNIDFDKIAKILEDEDIEFSRNFKEDEEYIRFNLDDFTQVTYYKDFVTLTQNTIFGARDEWIENYKEIKRMSFIGNK